MAANPYPRFGATCPVCGSRDEYPEPNPSVHTCGHRAGGATLIPEDIYTATAATEATRAEDLIRMAEGDSDAGDQIVCMIEEAAQELASAAMRLRVISRRLALGNVPGADRWKMQELADSWQNGRIANAGVVAERDAKLMASTAKACAIQLRNILDGDASDG